MSNADTNLLSGLVEKTEEDGYTEGITVTTFKLSGEPYANAIVNAVVANYNRITEREQPTAEELLERVGEKVTLVRTGENMLGSSILNAIEGKLFESSRGPGQLGILPKGARSKGFVVDPAKVIDIIPGYSTEQAQEYVASVRAYYPQLQNLTKERLLELPREGDGGETCALALLGEWRMPDSRSLDAIWLIGEYWPDEDICDRSVLLIRPEYGTSEHGSVYGDQLLRSNGIGEILDFEPIPYGAAIELCFVDFDVASKAIFDRAGVTA